MIKKIEITCVDDKKIILTEDSVCYVEQWNMNKEVAILHLSSGEILYCVDPPFESWRNDCFLN